MELAELTDKAIDYILSHLDSELHLTEWEKGSLSRTNGDVTGDSAISRRRLWGRYGIVIDRVPYHYGSSPVQ